MPDPCVLEVGELTDIDGVPLNVGVDYDSITLAGYRLNAEGAEQLAGLIIRACWMAGVNTQRMAPDV